MTRNLTTIFVISFVTVLAIVLAVLSLVSYQIFFDYASEEISGTRLALLNENTDKLSRAAREISDAGYYLAANPSLIEIFSEPPIDAYEAISEQRAILEQLSIMAGLKPNIHSLEIYTDRYLDYPMISDSRLRTLDELKAQPWYTILESMDSGWVPNMTNGRPMVSFVHRLVDHRGARVGYVKVNILEETFFTDLNVFTSADSSQGFVLIVDSGDRVLACSPADAEPSAVSLLTQRAEGKPYDVLKTEYRDMSNQYRSIRHMNEWYLLLVSELNDKRWKLMQLIPIEPLYAGTRKLGLIVALLGLGVLLLSVPMVYLLCRRLILRPIRKIIQGMKQVERGIFNTRVEPLFVEEFDYMAHHFNHMTNELQRLISEIEREHKARRDAEMRMLQNQIMPHFLYNTLDIIHWKAMDYQAEEISRMVNSLSKMFRIGLSGGRHFIRLRDELEHVRSYVEIQRMRAPQRRFEFEVTAPADCKNLYVPKIILQPFVENSMKHGYPDPVEDTVYIQIEVRKVHPSRELHIEIRDRGIGFPAGWSLETSTGIGMKNVQERIRMYCGMDFGIEIDHPPEGGARIILRLPILRTEQEAEQCLAFNSDSFDNKLRQLA